MRASNWFFIKYGFLLMIVLSCWTNPLQAQITAPDFRCVLNDTLFWELPVNNCGPFNAYLIYVSPSSAGPFSLLTTITDANQTQFYHNNPNDDERFYYLESDYNCPGEPHLTSDILDNQIPVLNPIERVSVVGNTVLVSWPSNPSPEVVGYIIYRTTLLGTIPIDTILSTTTYLDEGAIPDQQSEIYYVVAMDDCGNTSIFGSPHATIFLETIVNVCEQEAVLHWNSYVGWAEGLERQELWLGIDGASPTLITTLDPTAEEYLYEGLEDQRDYCFQIKAYKAGSNLESVSNEVCEVLDVVQPANSMVLENATVNAMNQVELIWQWNTNAELSAASILRADQENVFVPLDDLVLSDPLSNINQYLDPIALAAEQPYSYRLHTVDDCDTILQSNSVTTIHLSGFAMRDLSNQLSWTAFEHESGQVIAYELYRAADGLFSLVNSFSPTEQVYIDPIDGSKKTEAEVCYYLIAEAEIDLPSGGNQTIRSRSNTICIKQFSTVLIPNAFVPEGRNYEFKPRVLFSDNINYYLAIFDRWGQLIFESRAVDEGWNGKKGERLLPWGTYTYLIQIEQADGQTDEYVGPFVLLR